MHSNSDNSECKRVRTGKSFLIRQ